MGKSAIEWTQWTLEVSAGCTECSPGCRNCYARRIIWRLAHNPTCGDKYQGLVEKINGKLCWTGKIKLFPEHLEPVLRRKKPTTYFVDSRSDLFHEKVPFEFIDKVIEVTEVTPWHTYQLLTKRPEVMLEYFKWRWNNADQHNLDCTKAKQWLAEHKLLGNSMKLPNLWLGVTIEHPDYKDRADILRKIPAAKRFISFEPLLKDMGKLNLEGIDQVIVGGESGPGARPMHPDWVRSIRDQCQAGWAPFAESEGVPFFFKQWGEWLISTDPIVQNMNTLNFWPHRVTLIGDVVRGDTYFRVTKKKAGWLLDDEVHRELAV